jgi:NDP-sugar pyrophosphorylase family protein
MFKPTDLFDLSQTGHAGIFQGCEFAWDALKKLKQFIEANVKDAPTHAFTGGVFVGPSVIIGEGTVIEDGAMIKGPAIIGKNCEIRHGAYIRDYVLIGDGCVVGNSSEVKHSILFNGCQVPHFNYVGDSILGYKAHLGAGVILSNLKSLPGNVTVEIDGRLHDTGLRKFGAMVGDKADIGCNSVLNPGSVIGRGTTMYPLTNWRGAVGPNRIVKNKAAVEIVERRAK